MKDNSADWALPAVERAGAAAGAVLSFAAAEPSFRTIRCAWADWLDDWLAYQDNFGTGPDARIRAAHLMTFYAHYLTVAAGHLFLTSGETADLSPENLLVRFEAFDPTEGRPAAARRFHFRAIRPPMRGATHSLHDGLIDSLQPAVDALGQRSRLSAGSLWRLASDGVFGAFVEIGRALGEEERATALGLAVVEKDGSPFRSGAPRLERIVGHDGTERVFRIRSGCCLAYKAGEGRHCDVCVLLSPEERRRRLAAVTG